MRMPLTTDTTYTCHATSDNGHGTPRNTSENTCPLLATLLTMRSIPEHLASPSLPNCRFSEQEFAECTQLLAMAWAKPAVPHIMLRQSLLLSTSCCGESDVPGPRHVECAPGVDVAGRVSLQWRTGSSRGLPQRIRKDGTLDESSVSPCRPESRKHSKLAFGQKTSHPVVDHQNFPGASPPTVPSPAGARPLKKVLIVSDCSGERSGERAREC